jgi:hypothetical protein
VQGPPTSAGMSNGFSLPFYDGSDGMMESLGSEDIFIEAGSIPICGFSPNCPIFSVRHLSMSASGRADEADIERRWSGAQQSNIGLPEQSSVFQICIPRTL